MFALRLCVAVSSILLGACETTTVPAIAAASSSGTGGTGGAGGASQAGGNGACIEGERAGDGTCVLAGITDCIAEIIDADGVCRPSADHCASGSILVFDEGCVAVGIEDCHPDFMEDDGICHPSMVKCPGGTFAVPQLGCLPIDGAAGCGTGTWGNIADAPGTLWVDAASTTVDADGSQAKPFATLHEALEVAQDGARIALAAGQYTGPFSITNDVEIIGRCASLTRIQASDLPTYDAIIETADVEVTLRGLQIGGGGVGVHAIGGSTAIIECWVHEARRTGILGQGQVLIERTFVDAIGPGVDGDYGSGIGSADGGEVTVRSSAVYETRTSGVFAEPGGAISLADVLVEGTLAEEISDLYGCGASVVYGGTMLLEDVALVRNTDLGVEVYDAELTAKRVLVEDTLSDAAGYFGAGIYVYGAANAVIEQSILLHNRDCGLCSVEAGSSAVLSRSLVKDTQARPADGLHGTGVSVVLGAAKVVDTLVTGNHNAGLAVVEIGATLEVTGVLVEGTAIDEANFVSGGVSAESGAKATVSRSALVGNENTGLQLLGASTGELRQSLVSKSRRVAGFEVGGSSVWVARQATVIVEGARLEDGFAAGVLLFGTGTLSDVLISGTQMGPSWDGDPDTADGVLAVSANVQLLRVVARSNARAGFVFHGSAGGVHGSTSTGNGFGLVLQGATLPTLGDDNAVAGNGQDHLTGDPLLDVPVEP
jgi:hypothetical protein